MSRDDYDYRANERQLDEINALKAENERLRTLLRYFRGCLDPFVWEDECAEIDAALKEGQR